MKYNEPFLLVPFLPLLLSRSTGWLIDKVGLRSQKYKTERYFFLLTIDYYLDSIL